MRHKKAPKRQTPADKLHNNKLVAKFINNVMKSGKKTVAEDVVYGAFTIIEEKTKENPVAVFERAIQTVGPKIEVRARRVGGANYQVPAEVRGERKVSLAIRWILEGATARPNTDFKKFSEKLAAELMDASQNQGSAAKKRDNVLKQAEANRAFSHFR